MQRFQINWEEDKSKKHTNIFGKNASDAIKNFKKKNPEKKIEGVFPVPNEFDLTIDLKNPDIYIDYGKSKFDAKDYKRALQDFKKAFQLLPNSAYILSLKARSEYFIDKKNQYIIEDLNKAIQLNPNDPISYYYRSLAKLAQNKSIIEVLEDINKAIELDQNC